MMTNAIVLCQIKLACLACLNKIQIELVRYLQIHSNNGSRDIRSYEYVDIHCTCICAIVCDENRIESQSFHYLYAMNYA